MKEIDRGFQEKILITAYWPRRNVDETNIGYGLRKDKFFFQIVGVFYTLIGRILGTFVEPRVRPIVRPGVRLALWLLPGIGIAILTRRGSKSTGFYQLDDEGRPLLFLSRMQPEHIQGHMGVSRKRFLSNK